MGFTDTGSNFEIQWDTSVGYNYQLDVGMDFTTWVDTGIVETGTGSIITYAALVDDEGLDEAKLFFRVRETFDDYDGDFLDLPTENQVIELIDGVRFGFDLMEFPTLPARIRVYVRDAAPGEAWDHVGTLTEFAEIDAIRFVRGSVVWLPDDVGNYEVRVAVVDTNDAAIAIADRSIAVVPNVHPTVEFLGGPPTSSANRVWAQFNMQTSNDAVRVEYYDNGVLIGAQKVGHFGDVIIESYEQEFGIGQKLYLERGTHTVSAIAFDARGLTGATTSNYVVEITGGNARPQLDIVSPQDGFTVLKGQTFTIGYSVSDPDGSTNVMSVRVEKVFGGDAYEEFVLNSVQPSQDLTVDTTSLGEGAHTLKVYAKDGSDARSYPRYLKIYVTGAIPSVFVSTLATNMIDSASITISNETFTGIEASSGNFLGGLAAGMQIDAGVLLTSGSFGIWNGGNSRDDMSEHWDGFFSPKYEEPGDLALDLMGVGLGVSDAATLEMDVSCEHSQLEVEYQFGSEEYVEHVSDRGHLNCYNDAFLLSVDGTPVSLLPDGSDIVSVRDVHPAATSECAGSVEASLEELYVDGSVITNNATATPAEYDGTTIRLRAHVLISGTQDKHFRFSITDVHDDLYDSGLFIEGSSVRSISPAP